MPFTSPTGDTKNKESQITATTLAVLISRGAAILSIIAISFSLCVAEGMDL